MDVKHTKFLEIWSKLKGQMEKEWKRKKLSIQDSFIIQLTPLLI